MEEKIKLTDEQLLEKQVQLEKNEMQLEVAALNMAHFKKMIENDFPGRSAQVEMNNLKKQIDMVRHNVKALQQQIDAGEI